MAATSSLPDVTDEIEWSAPCAGSKSGRHVRRVHYVAPQPGIVCDRPVRVACDQCSASRVFRCGCHRSSKCVPCAERYRRRLSRVVEDGARRREGGHLYLLTLTAPGESEHARWDPGFQRGSRPTCDCHRGVELASWNPSAAACWNRLRTALRREHPDLVFLRAVEVQKRGALHLHVVVWSSRSLDVLVVQELALAAGFGCTLDLDPIVGRGDASRRVARYVAKYVTKSVDSRDDVPWAVELVDYDTGELVRVGKPATFRAWSASRTWGVTMREIRSAAARAAALSASRLLALETVALQGISAPEPTAEPDP